MFRIVAINSVNTFRAADEILYFAKQQLTAHNKFGVQL